MFGVPKNKVILMNHNEKWAEAFEKTKQILIKIHGDNVVDIQHVGSTAIKGIMAKPMLDIAIVLKSITDFVFSDMTENGYTYYGEVIPGKYLFILRGVDEVSLQHVHCYEEKNCAPYFDQIKFRDFIRSHPEYAREYERLKKELYKIHSNDRSKYTEGKQAFFDKIKRLADEEP
jgi:GrpB-like predicted nucleotidyltransferase (UPF0157 family)